MVLKGDVKKIASPFFKGTANKVFVLFSLINSVITAI
jgi:hypothetical protein